MALLQVQDLKTWYSTRGGTLRAVDGVTFELHEGETLALVGESGCGKSSLGKSLLRLAEPTAGSIRWRGQEVTGLGTGAMRALRREMQMVFQDPFASLNPRHKIGRTLEVPLIVHGLGTRAERQARVAGILAAVGLPEEAAERFPHEFSGGQRQRIGIARALIMAPKLLILDEPVSALDLSIQAQVLNLLVRAKRDFGLSYVFISHDLSVVRYFADRVLVMYLGRIVESGPVAEVQDAPQHPYTSALMRAVPDATRRREAAPLAGDLPSPLNPPPGCRFHTRCPRASEICRQTMPELTPVPGRPASAVACHHPGP